MIQLPQKPIIAIFLILLGATLGLAGYTFIYAEGFSYFSKDPKACVNCHVMNHQYESWGASGHHHVATCADCHLPASGISKYLAKARNGWNHSSAFTLENFEHPIQITPKNSEILEENCRRCHDVLVHEVEPESCVHCHRNVGHMPIH